MDFINMNDWIIVDFEESSSQSLLVIMVSKSYTCWSPSILERKFFAVESKFLSLLSIVASYLKSTCKCQALYMYLVGRRMFHVPYTLTNFIGKQQLELSTCR